MRRRSVRPRTAPSTRNCAGSSTSWWPPRGSPPGVDQALATLAAAGTHITVVSGLAIAAVRTFLAIHGLTEHVRHLAARTSPDPAVLPPAPTLITTALHHRAIPTGSCLFVGGTDVDLTAARAAGIDTIRHHRLTTAPPGPWFDALTASATS